MKPEYYDFAAGSWSYDWPKLDVMGSNLVLSEKAEVVPYDRIDLLILKELDANARRSMVTIAKNVDAGYKTVHRHYLDHVLGRGLIKGYRILWPGSRYDFEREKAMTKKAQVHRICKYSQRRNRGGKSRADVAPQQHTVPME